MVRNPSFAFQVWTRSGSQHQIDLLANDVLNKVENIGSGYPAKPFSYGENIACFLPKPFLERKFTESPEPAFKTGYY